MKLVNANIKSIGEAAQRIVEGEKLFINDGNMLYFDNGIFYRGTLELRNWSYFKEWQVEKPHTWEDDASGENPVLCWVGQQTQNNYWKVKQVWVDTGGTELYMDKEDIHYNHAWPVEPKDCWKAEDD